MGKYLPGKADYGRAIRRKSSWVGWLITGAVCFGLGYLSQHGWHL